MQKIKSIKELKEEKRRLEQYQELIELRISDNWKELKDSLQPSSIIKSTYNNTIFSGLANVLNSKNLFTGVLIFGGSLLVKKLAEKGSQKFLGKFFKSKQR